MSKAPFVQNHQISNSHGRSFIFKDYGVIREDSRLENTGDGNNYIDIVESDIVHEEEKQYDAISRSINAKKQ
jgi:hypothetical protein